MHSATHQYRDLSNSGYESWYASTNTPIASENESDIANKFFQGKDGIRDYKVTGVQTCALPIYSVHWMDGAKYRNHDEHQHDHDIDTHSPEQHPHAKRKLSSAKPSFLFGGDDLVRFQQRQNHARIFKIRLHRGARDGIHTL